MTKTEKVILCVIATLIIGVVISVTYVAKSIDEAGGMKAVIIEAGKEIKDISNKIAEE